MVDEWPDAVALRPGRSAGGVLRLRATGPLDAAVHRQVVRTLAGALAEVAARGDHRIEVDLAEAGFLSAAVAGALAHGAHRAAEQHCALRVVNATGSTARVLVLARLWHTLCGPDD